MSRGQSRSWRVRSGRRAAAALALGLAATVLAGCGGDEKPSTRQSGDTCSGGQIRLLRGRPADLPGGGTVGIGSVHLDDDPPSVRLVLAGEHGPAPDTGRLTVGDSFAVDGASYEITAICADRVNARSAG